MAMAPTRNKPTKIVRPSRENAEQMADIIVQAVEKKLAGLPKEQKMKERGRVMASFC